MHNDIKNLTKTQISPIHGTGLFAHKMIKKGQIIGYIKGENTNIEGPYTLWISENQSILVEGKLKYINHSTTPNACYYDDLTVVALRDIAKGEEITHHYGDEWD